YLDECLLHWPGIVNDRMLRAAAALLSLRDSGKIKSVGVSNFQIEHLESYAARFGFYPSVNQIELHPFYQQRALVSFCVEHGIKVIAWSPILRARTLCVGVISAIAAAHRKSAAQIVLRWHVQKGHIPIPKSSNPIHILENRAVFNFSLADEEIAAIDALENGVHIGADPYTFNG
ncbi:MAG: aldo/keto reductase, partial [Clostridia bacterium]